MPNVDYWSKEIYDFKLLFNLKINWYFTKVVKVKKLVKETFKVNLKNFSNLIFTPFLKSNFTEEIVDF